MAQWLYLMVIVSKCDEVLYVDDIKHFGKWPQYLKELGDQGWEYVSQEDIGDQGRTRKILKMPA